MMAAWERAKLGDLVETQKGYAFKSGWYCDSGRPIVKVSNFTDDSIDSTTLVCIPESIATDYLKYEIRAGDVVVQTVGSWPNNPASVVGKCVRTPRHAARALLNQNAVKLSPADCFNRTFLFYLLRNEDFKTYIIGTAQGAASQAAITLEAIRCYEFELPPLPTQCKIAAILSAYDDLIENNLRRIKILEEMAQNLYREWFVKFRFPGWEKARFVDSPVGRIPEGWEVVSFTDIADVLSGGTPKTAVPEYWGGEIPFFAPKDTPASFFVTETEKRITELGLSKCNSKFYPPLTIFITARGTVGKVVMPAVAMAMNQSCYALRGKPGISQTFLFLATLEQVTYLKKNTGGATFDTIVVDTFHRMQVIRPEDTIVVNFTDHVESIFGMILNLIKRSTTLRRTRDLLLPKLISGEVDVSELDIAVPEEATA